VRARNYLAETDSEEPTSSSDGGDDEGQTEQEADVGNGQTGNVAITDGATALVAVTNDHQQDESVSHQPGRADNSVDGRHCRVDGCCAAVERRIVD